MAKSAAQLLYGPILLFLIVFLWVCPILRYSCTVSYLFACCSLRTRQQLSGSVTSFPGSVPNCRHTRIPAGYLQIREDAARLCCSTLHHLPGFSPTRCRICLSVWRTCRRWSRARETRLALAARGRAAWAARRPACLAGDRSPYCRGSVRLRTFSS